MTDAVEDRPKRRGLLLAIAAAVAVVLVVVLVWFQPQKLFIDDAVDEALPTASEGDDTAPTTGADGSSKTAVSGQGTEILGEGAIRSLSHKSSGRALLVEAGGKVVLRFEDLSTDNGPDLRVYLSKASSDSDDGAFDDDFVDLGALKGNKGNQNYDVPADVDVSQYKSAVVWCRRFSVGFAVAPVES